MNFVGKFDAKSSVDSGHNFGSFGGDTIHHQDGHDAITIPDAHLLFTGDFKRSGLDLILSKDDHELVVQDYFRGEKRAALASPDGARLTGDLVDALVGQVQYAQASGAVDSGKIIGQVTKLSGNATAVRNGVSIILNMGDNVYKGDVVQSGSDSQLGITFIDGTVFGLSSNARMVLNEMVYDPNGSNNSSLLSLVAGTITFVAGQTAKHGDMKIDTPVATMGIRGTAVLVEIDFTVPGQGDAPPVKFQVLAEPDGTTGSYVLYSKTSPGVVIGRVDQAGQVFSVTAAQGFTVQAAPPLPAEAAAIIQQVFTQKFNAAPPAPDKADPNKTDPNKADPAKTDPAKTDPNKIDNKTDAKPQQTAPSSTSVTQEATKSGDTKVTVTTTTIADTQAAASTQTLTGAAVTSGLTAPSVTPPTTTITTETLVVHTNVPPVITKAAIAVSQGHAVTLKPTDIVVTDLQNVSSFTFTVANVTHGSFQVEGSSDPTRFTTEDLSAGRVSFLHDGSKVAPTFSIRADDGATANGVAFHGVSDAVPVTVAFTAINAPPVTTAALMQVSQGATVVLTSSSIGVTDPDSANFTFTVSNVTHGKFQLSTDGTNWSDFTASTTFTNVDLAAGHVRFVQNGDAAAPTFSVLAIDDAGSVDPNGPFTATVNFGNVNHPPLITAASLSVTEGKTAFLTAANLSVSDPDSTSFIFKVSGVTHGTFETTADGITWVTATTFTSTDLAATHVRFVHDGSDAAPTFSIQADDRAPFNNLSNTLAGAVNFTNLNDAPIITAGGSGGFAELPGTANPALHTVSGVINFTDSDLGDRPVVTASFASFVYVDAQGFNNNFNLSPAQLAAVLAAEVPLTIAPAFGNTNNGSASWAYTGVDRAFDFLSADESLRLTYAATVNDGNGGTATAPLIVTVTGTNDIPVVAAGTIAAGSISVSAAGGEAAGTSVTSRGTIRFVDADLSDAHTATFSYTGQAPALGTLALIKSADTTGTGAGGQFGWTYSADTTAVRTALDGIAGHSKVETFDVVISDGHGGSFTQAVSVSLDETGNHPPTGSVTINGTAQKNQVLTANTSTLADADGLGSIGFQWQRDGANINSATFDTYTLGNADVGHTLDVVASYTDGLGKAEHVTSAATAVVANVNDAPTGSVTIVGTQQENQLLRADTSTLADADGLGIVGFQWQRDGVNIGGANSATYLLVTDDVGHKVEVVASYVDGHGTAEHVTSAPTNTISAGTVIVGDNGDNTLTGTNGNDTFQGFGGDDTINGLLGFDRALYSDATDGITARLTGTGGTVSGSGVGTDTLNGVESIQGSDFADHFDATGFNGNAGVPGTPIGFNGFEGLGGDDVIVGGINPSGQMTTRISYVSATSGVTVNFNGDSISSPGTADGDVSVGHDTFSNVVAVVGSAYRDLLTGSDNPSGTYEQFDGRGGDDVIDGRGGYDFAVYNNDPATTTGISVNLAAGIVIGDASIGTDTLRSVEGVRGTNFADTYDATGFSGTSTNAGSLTTFNNFDGLGGDDSITGNGNTRIQYTQSTAGVTVDLADTSTGGTGTARGDASVGTDTIHGGVNAVLGSMFDDILLGSSANETFAGLAGNDFIDGRGGFDTAQYSNLTFTTGGITAHLAAGVVTGDASSGTDTLRSIEGIQGTFFADTFDATNFGSGATDPATGQPYANIGSNGTFNQFEGMGGDDSITGNGNTRILYINATDGVTVDLTLGFAHGTAAGDIAGIGTDTIVGGVNSISGSNFNDTLTGDSGNNILLGNAGNDVINGGGGNDTITGGAGDDIIDGGTGADIAVFSGSSSQYTITRSSGVTTVTDGVSGRDGTDTLTNVELLQFSDRYVLTSSGTSAAPTSIAGASLSGTNPILARAGTNNDFVSISPNVFGHAIDLGAGTDTVVLNAAGGYTLSLLNVENLQGSSGNDNVTLQNLTGGLSVDLAGGTNNLTLANGSNSLSVSNVSNIFSSDFGAAAASNDTLTLLNNINSNNNPGGLSVNLNLGVNALNLAAGINSLAHVNNVQRINGTSSSDTLTLTGGLFQTTVDLGGGDDTVVLSNENFVPSPTSPTLVFYNFSLLGTEHLTGANGANYAVTLQNNINSQTAPNGLAVNLGSGHNSLTLAGGANTLSVSNVSNIYGSDYTGAPSNDTLTLLNNINSLSNPGGLSFDLGLGANTLNLAAGANTLSNLNNVQTINGSASDDTLTFTNAVFQTTVDLGAGSNDTVDILAGTGFFSNLSLLNVEHLAGSAGDDFIRLNNSVSGLAVDLGAGNDTLALANGSNSVSITNVENLQASDFGSAAPSDDTLALLNDVIGVNVNLGQGTNTLNLAAGVNSLANVYNVQTINGTSSDDTLTLTNGIYQTAVNLGAGNNDTVVLSNENVPLNPQGFVDSSLSLLNVEYLTGSVRSDYVHLRNNQSGLSVDLGQGDNTLELAKGNNGVSLANVQHINGSDYTGAPSDDTLTLLNNVAGLSVNLFTGTNTLNLAAGANSLTGLFNVQSVNGSASDDTLTLGQVGNSAGPTKINLGAGDDTLNLATNSFGVTFVSADNGGADTISGFSNAKGDKVDLVGVSGIYSIDDVKAHAVDAVDQSSVTITFSTGNSLKLNGIVRNDLVASEFVFASHATNTFTGGTSGTDPAYSNPANWSLGHVPAGADVISISGGHSVLVNGATINSNEIDVDGANSLLQLAGADLVGVTLKAINLASGAVGVEVLSGPATTFDGSFSPLSISSGTTVKIENNATLTLQGTIHNDGLIDVDISVQTPPPLDSYLKISGAVTLSGNGRVSLDSTSTATDSIVSDGSPATLTNSDNTIQGVGVIGDANLTLINGMQGVISATDASGKLMINTGTNAFTNHGLVVSSNSGGLDIASDVFNDGTLQVDAGTFEVHGAVTGQGTATINGGIMEFDAASDAHVQFLNTAIGMLALSDLAAFTGTISGFADGDRIDLGSSVTPTDVNFISHSSSIDLNYGSGTLSLTGSYAPGDFSVYSSHGETFIGFDHPPVFTSTEATASVSGAATGPELVTNGGFETGNFTGWAQGGNSSYTSVGTSSHSGSFAAHMGPVGSDGTFTQNIATAAGHSYHLDFWLQNDYGPTNDFSASWNSTQVTLLTNQNAFGYQEFSADVVATADLSTLQFAFRQDPSYWDLDDISVRENGQGASGTLSFADPDATDTHSATFSALGASYIGTFSLSGVTENSGSGSVGWNLSASTSAVAALQNAVTQSYDVTVDDHHTAGAIVQRVDVSIGTPQADNFVFHPGIGSDVITNFALAGANADQIDLEGFASVNSPSDLHALLSENSHHDAVLGLGGGDSITFAGITAAQLDPALTGFHVNLIAA